MSKKFYALMVYIIETWEILECKFTLRNVNKILIRHVKHKLGGVTNVIFLVQQNWLHIKSHWWLDVLKMPKTQLRLYLKQVWSIDYMNLHQEWTTLCDTTCFFAFLYYLLYRGWNHSSHIYRANTYSHLKFERTQCYEHLLGKHSAGNRDVISVVYAAGTFFPSSMKNIADSGTWEQEHANEL